MKFLSWILYLIAKKNISKTTIGPRFTECGKTSKIIGGIAGFLIGVASCAIIASPVTEPVIRVDQSGAVDSAFHIAEMVSELTDQTDLSADESFTPADLKKAYNSVVHSPASYICRFTGTEWIATRIYSSISSVSPKMIGTEKDEEIRYSFPVFLTNVLSIANKIDRVMTLFHDGKRFCLEVLDSLEDIAFYFLDASVLTDTDKLAMLNSSIASIESAFEDLIGFSDDKQIFKPFTSYEQFREDIHTVFAIARIPASLIADRDSKNLDSIFDLTTVEIMNDDRLIGDFIHLMFKLNSGVDVVASFINNVVADLASTTSFDALGLPTGDITSPEQISAAGEEAVIQTCKDLALLISIGEPTLDNQDQYLTVYNRLKDGGVVKFK